MGCQEKNKNRNEVNGKQLINGRFKPKHINNYINFKSAKRQRLSDYIKKQALHYVFKRYTSV